MDELLRQAAENMGMPPALAERSARARAEKEGTTVEAVLAEWAGAEPPESAPAGAPTSAPEDAEALETTNEGADSPPAATAAPDPQPSAGPSEASAPTEVSTDYLVALAADAKRMPEKLVRSSAEARARNAGADLDEVLAAWAGVDLADLHARAEAGEPLPEAEPESPAPPTPPAAEEAPAPAATSEPEEAPEQAPAAAAPAAATAALSADELLEQAAAAKGMPASIAKRSAEARAKKEGTSLEAVLAEWAGVDPSTVGAAAAPEAAAPQTEAPAAEAPAAAAPAAATAALSADELLEQAAAAKGMPASIAKRSAEARAKKEGTSLEAVLAEWAGVDPSTVGTAPAASAPAEQPEATTGPGAPAETADTGADDVEVIEPPSGPDEPFDEEDELAPTPARGGYPAWLAAAFVIIPLLAVTYILVSPNGPDCGTAGQLDIDPVTGLAVNCDGSEYGGSSVDFFAQGAGIYSQCAACHGANGEGGGNFPAFTGGAVLATFPAGQCSDHVEWVTLGTANFDEPTYGATNKPVGGSGAVMPGYEGVLTPEQIASVSLYERVQFGGQPLEEALSDCGLVEGEEGTGDGTEDMTEASGG